MSFQRPVTNGFGFLFMFVLPVVIGYKSKWIYVTFKDLYNKVNVFMLGETIRM